MHNDIRGYALKPFAIKEMETSKLRFSVNEIFYSSSKKDVIRGMHFQLPPCTQGKMVNVVKGKIIDVLLDLRIDSPTYGKFISIELEEGDGKVVYIPQGLAHGFASLANESVVLYLFDSPYSPQSDSGIRYDSFGYKWRIREPSLSNRDLGFVSFEEFASSFKMEEDLGEFS